MKCEICGARKAVIHVQQVIGKERVDLHLCEECARKKGISVTISGDEPTGSDVRKNEPVIDITCSRCGCTYEQFRSKGWLGCAECYTAFEKEIDTILMQMHGSLMHKGKRYRTPGSTPQALTVEIKRLRHELAIAIKNEEFEQAATIRDAIHSIKQMGVQ